MTYTLAGVFVDPAKRTEAVGAREAFGVSARSFRPGEQKIEKN